MTAHKARARAAISPHADEVTQLAHGIHEHPEIAYAEEYAASHLAEYLEGQGFAVRKGVHGMPTALVATVGNGPLHVGFCAEYDALPPACLGAVSSGGATGEAKELGLREVWLSDEREDVPLRHACGHNLIAGSAVAAAVGLRDLVSEVGLTISVFGTPGEELCALPEPPEGRLVGGKIGFLEAGAFAGINAVLMIHPGPTPWSMFYPTHTYLRLGARFSRGSADGRRLGAAELRRLEESLSQTVRLSEQVPALFAARPEDDKDGARADLLWIAPSRVEGLQTRDAVRHSFEQAASEVGASVEIVEYAVDAELHNDPLLSAAYRENSRVLGRLRERDPRVQAEIREIMSSPQLPLATRLVAPLLRAFPRLVAPSGLFLDRCPTEVVWGTDLAPVSEVIPCIQPFVGVGGLAGVHSVEFADQADSDEAYRAMLDAGVALAWTALDAATDSAIKSHLLESAAARSGASPSTTAS